MYNLLEYSSNYSNARGSSWFYFKDEATNFNLDIADTDNFKSFKYKTKLLGKTVAEGARWNIKKYNNYLPLKYLSNFWRSLETLFINCKVELKLKWKNHCLLPPNGNDNDGVHSNNIIFTIKEIVKDSKLGKDLTEQFIGINIKQKVRIKIRQMKIDIF